MLNNLYYRKLKKTQVLRSRIWTTMMITMTSLSKKTRILLLMTMKSKRKSRRRKPGSASRKNVSTKLRKAQMITCLMTKISN